MADLFIELLIEEIPARMQNAANEQFKDKISEFFKTNGLEFGQVETFISPRRMIANVKDLALEKPEVIEEKRGPRVDAPQKAIDGFMKGLSSDQFEIKETPKGKFYFANITKPAVATIDVLPKMLQEILLKFHWPKSMRWATTSYSWVRPIQSGICIFNDQVLDFAISMKTGEIIEKYHGDEYEIVKFSNKTKGHRNSGNKDLIIKNFDHYQQQMKQNHVVFDQSQREKFIKGQIQKILDDHNLGLLEDEKLLNEVIGLAESPHVLLGKIPQEFMDLPEPVLITCMATHNKYFATRNQGDSKMAPYFLAVADYLEGGYDKSLAGYERVLKARLSDANFFFKQDQKQKLSDFAPKLASINFHNKLGTIADKVSHVQAVARSLAYIFEDIDTSLITHTVQLCKCDLSTQMVYEFPNLQGIMGGVYAKINGEREEVATAIGQHYMPQGVNDDLPQNNLGALISTADKLDTLIGFFSIGIKPTGSKDPFALRRCAIGIIRILETKENAILGELVEQAIIAKNLKPKKLLPEIMEFFQERIKYYWLEQGLSHGAINAVIGKIDYMILADLKLRAKALDKFITQDNELLQLYKRLNNILKAADIDLIRSEIDKTLLQANSEIDLYQYITDNQNKFDQLYKDKEYIEFLNHISGITPYLSDFFDNVMVNVDDDKIRLNRLALLQMVNNLLQKFADFDKI